MADVLAITKLVVGDLEKAKAFYSDLCGLTEERRIEGEVDGRKITEIIMAGDARGGVLVLFTFHGAPAPSPGECMLVFETRDIDAFVQRAVSAGGSIMQPVTKLPDLDLSFGFVRDPEGHIVEALQRGLSR